MKENQSPFQISLQREDGQSYWLITNHLFKGPSGSNYELRVRRFHGANDNGELNSYKFFNTDYSLGDPVQIVTQEVFDAMKQAVIDNEGEEALNTCRWLVEGEVRVFIRYEEEIMHQLIRRWEAMCEVVSPHYTIP